MARLPTVLRRSCLAFLFIGNGQEYISRLTTNLIKFVYILFKIIIPPTKYKQITTFNRKAKSMLFAINEYDDRILAKPGLVGICPDCGEKVIAKCGEINRWHWCHTVMTDCKSAKETEWHQKWKRYMGLRNAERPIIKNGITKRADTLLPHGTVVEYQNSPITPSEIGERYEHYQRIVWIFNLWGKADRVIIRDMDNDRDGNYPRFHVARDIIFATSCPVMTTAKRLRLILPRGMSALAAVDQTPSIYFLDLNDQYLFFTLWGCCGEGKAFDGRLIKRQEVKQWLIDYDFKHRRHAEFFA